MVSDTGSKVKWLLIPVAAGLLSGCAISPRVDIAPPAQAIPTLQGSYHQVRSGETLWRISHSYGVDLRTLVEVNRLSDARELRSGQQLFIPLPDESNQFLWPVYGFHEDGASAGGLEISASPGMLVRASRGGRVAVAAQRLSGRGKTVIIDHLDGYLSIYAGLAQILVPPGATLRQGTPIGSLGSAALYFEIRRGRSQENTLALLPAS